jgi:DNA-binding transcriptional ArsR family regulator
LHCIINKLNLIMSTKQTTLHKQTLFDPAKIAAYKRTWYAFRAVNHTFRQSLIDLLSESGSQTVTNLMIKTRVEQSVMSQHLAVLRKQDIVITKRKGREIFYSLNAEKLEKLNNAITALAAV